MISSISWVPKGAAKSVPVTADPPSKEEIEEMLKSGLLDKLADNETGEDADADTMDVESSKADDNEDALVRALTAAEALGCSAPKSSSMGADGLSDALKELDMYKYDEEDDNGVELFGSNNVYYQSNEMDPYLKSQGDEDSEEEEDIIIKADDSVIVCARNEDDVSHLEVWILEDPSDESTMYVHHDIVIPAFPLCTAWLDCPLKGGEQGNFIAVGSMDPAIEIWDLDVMDEVQPSVILGGTAEKKKKGKKKSIKYKDGSHTDSVLGLAWNKTYRNLIASASADKLVKVWDMATGTCCMTMENHTDKVQTVAWNHRAPEVLLSGSFDRTVVMHDGREKQSNTVSIWAVAADVENLAWDPHNEHSFVVSLENGMVSGFDDRTGSKDSSSQPKPTFTIHAHDKAVCTVAYSGAEQNVLATGSMDKMVKLWDLSSQPSCVASKNPKAGAIFSISFSEDCPSALAIGGSKGKLLIWNLSSDDAIAGRYKSFGKQTKPPPS